MFKGGSLDMIPMVEIGLAIDIYPTNLLVVVMSDALNNIWERPGFYTNIPMI